MAPSNNPEWEDKTGCDCDGYHTFDELYDHRIRLYIALCRMLSKEMDVWASKKHADDTTFGDWFVLGIGKEKGKQITYHLPAWYWKEVTAFAPVLDKAPEWDGHTGEDVLIRLKDLTNKL